MLMSTPVTTRSWRLALVVCIAGTGCARPEPVMETAPMNTAADALPVSDGIAQVELAAAVPAKQTDLSVSELDRRTAELFGASLKLDAALPVDSGMVGGGDV